MLALADAMTETPARVDPELFERLRTRLTQAQLVELCSSLAWKNYLARFNRVFDVEAGA